MGDNLDSKGLPEGVLKRLKRAVTKSGGYAVVSAKAGVPMGTLQKMMRGASDPRFSTIVQLAQFLEVSLDYLITGVGDESGDWETRLPAQRIGEKRIPIRDISASAGFGADVFGEDPNSWITFSLKWLMELGNPDMLEIIKVEGDSMQPELHDGDQVMIDRSQRQIKDGMFVVLVDERLFIKRLRVLGRNKVELVSSNTNYQPFEVSLPDESDDIAQDGAAIIGKVVWSGRMQ
jgi:phage repressor protein C with HTH and peptisase S24 domain